MNFIVMLIGFTFGVYGVVKLFQIGYDKQDFKYMVYAVVASMTVGLIYGMAFYSLIG